MDGIIELKETPLMHTYLKRLKPLSKTNSEVYNLLTNDIYNVRVGSTKENEKCVMPPWGPLLIKGHLIPKTNIKIVDIQVLKIGNVPRYLFALKEENNDLPCKQASI